MTTIVAFDPGETTGFAAGQWLGGKEIGLTEVTQILWDDRFYHTRDLLKFHRPDHVIVEAFRLYPHRAKSQIGKTFPSSQMIGIIQAYAYEQGILNRVTIQPASNRSSVKIPDEHLLMVGSSSHIQDAYRHLRYFVIVNLLRKGVGIV